MYLALYSERPTYDTLHVSNIFPKNELNVNEIRLLVIIYIWNGPYQHWHIENYLHASPIISETLITSVIFDIFVLHWVRYHSHGIFQMHKQFDITKQLDYTHSAIYHSGGRLNKDVVLPV